MLARCWRGPASVSELAQPLAMSLPAVLQHLKALEGERADPQRRRRAASAPAGWNPGALVAAEQWLVAEPPRRMGSPPDRLEEYVDEIEETRRMTMADKLDLVLERTIDAPREPGVEGLDRPRASEAVVRARSPMRSPKCELDLRPGGIFRIRMTGPDGFDTGHGNAGCVLEVVDGKKLAWTSALGPALPARPKWARAARSFPMTAIVTFEDAGNGKTAYRAVALHKNAADREKHEQDGLPDGWGTCRRPARGVRQDAQRQRLGPFKRKAPDFGEPGASLSITRRR